MTLKFEIILSWGIKFWMNKEDKFYLILSDVLNFYFIDTSVSLGTRHQATDS